jgi:hypothetical protein
VASPHLRARDFLEFADIAPNLRNLWTRLFPRIVNRGYGNHAGVDTELFKLLDRFRNEANGECQNMQG